MSSWEITLSAPVGPLSLFLIADRPDWAPLLSDCLLRAVPGASLISAPSWEAASGLVDERRPTVILATPARQPDPARCRLPVVLLLDEAPEALPPGAVDWLPRHGLDPALLQRCLRYVADQQRLKRTMEQLAEQDPLTGIPNRQGFQTLLATRLAESDERLILGHLDLDNFRSVNDSLGQRAGDRLIQQLVGRLRDCLEPADRLARLGSDEFALLLAPRSAEGLHVLAERLMEELGEPYRLDDESRLLGCSLGLARASRGQGIDPLIWQAQLAMQRAKSRPGCTFHVFDPRVDGGARSLADLQAELRRALRRDELELYYQPRLRVADQRLVGVEALVRWNHPERGLLHPGEFIPLAEQTGLIVPLGYWVISRALRDMQWLLGRGFEPIHMAINLSFRQFQDSRLLPILTRLIRERGVDPRWLEFELTETAVLQRSGPVRQSMLELQQMGVRFALDDFGTGFSSFAHLSSLPISLLKVDKSFVAEMQQAPEKGRLVGAIVELAHRLGLGVVAEGVEQPAQLQRLREMGCDEVQGYLLSPPLALRDLARRQLSGRWQPALC